MKFNDEYYMRRCFELAKNGISYVSPNPLVGAVVVHENEIIGEGFHTSHGSAHAEVNAINSVKNKNLLIHSKLYVSLEPCSHYGLTPPCTELIIKNKIPKVIIACLDPNEKVSGKGVKALKSSNIEVITGILEEEAIFLNRRFITFHTKKRPYIILKWAQSKNYFIDIKRNDFSKEKALKITNDYADIIVHKWRTEEDAILVGSNTVISDNPRLTARHWHGINPIRICFDRFCKLDKSFNIFNSESTSLIFNSIKDENINNIKYIKIDYSDNILQQVLDKTYSLGIQSIIVEGGTETINRFISLNLWDEARVFSAKDLIVEDGIAAPSLNMQAATVRTYNNNELNIYYNI